MVGIPPTVKTTGLNWDSLAVILSAIVVTTGAITAYIRRTVKGSVDHLAEVLVERLETKEKVAELGKTVALQGLEIRELKARRK